MKELLFYKNLLCKPYRTVKSIDMLTYNKKISVFIYVICLLTISILASVLNLGYVRIFTSVISIALAFLSIWLTGVLHSFWANLFIKDFKIPAETMKVLLLPLLNFYALFCILLLIIRLFFDSTVIYVLMTFAINFWFYWMFYIILTERFHVSKKKAILISATAFAICCVILLI